MKKIAIIGGGSAGIYAASFLDTTLFDVTIYEKTNRLGRKFLVAGHGGLNLSQNVTIEDLKSAYRPAYFMDRYLHDFDLSACREYFDNIGVQTFIGTSGKIFPKDLKPAEVLKAMIDSFGKVNIVTQVEFQGFKDKKPIINGEIIDADYYIFALGGASWAKTGSDGKWAHYFDEINIKTESFRPSNCGWQINWNENIKNQLAFRPLKNIAVQIGNHSISGEAMITDYGIEGGAIYRSTWAVKGHLKQSQNVQVALDLKPTMQIEKVIDILTHRKKAITATLKNVLKLEDEKIELLRHSLSKEDFSDAKTLAHHIKAFPIKVTALAPIDAAISTTGGINLTEIDEHLQLNSIPNTFCIGEMLDYDTITGGYLLQSTMSMAHYVANHLKQSLL